MASTYVNDLRLNEMATGDGAGTWGTTTNTNLELILPVRLQLAQTHCLAFTLSKTQLQAHKTSLSSKDLAQK